MEVLELLDAKNIPWVHKGGDEYAIECVNSASHQGSVDSKASLNINIEKLQAFCFACGFSMNEQKLVRWLTGGELDDLSLETMALRAKIKRIQTSEDKSLSEARQIFIPPGEPWSEDGFRGISLETYRKLGAIHCTRGFYSDRIVFPVYVGGELIGVDARALKGQEPKYLRPKGCSCKTDWLYPYDLVKAMKPKYVVIGEGIYHAIACTNANIPGLAIFGVNNWSKTKLRMILALGVEEVIYFKDNDKAGLKAEQLICSTLQDWLHVTSADTSRVPEGKDLGDLTKEEIQWALDNRTKPMIPECLPEGTPEFGKQCKQRRCSFYKDWRCQNVIY